MINDKPVPIEFPKPITVWEYAQACLQTKGRGVVAYSGAGTPCRYLPGMLFINEDESTNEIRTALRLYDPLKEVIIATPTEENSEVYDIQIVKAKHSLARLLLGLNLKGEDL